MHASGYVGTSSAEARIEPRSMGSRAWGSAAYLGVRALTTGLGMAVIALADYRARRGMEPSEPLFWLGLVILVAPIAFSLFSPSPTRAERIGLVLLLGLGLYSAKILYNPGSFIFFDEFSHWRTALDIGSTHTLLTANQLQPISARYPGLEALTAIFASASGLPIETAGPIVVGIARAMLVVGMFILFERAGGSARVAGIGVLIYTANQSFLFFDADFSYESFAIAMAAIALVALSTRIRSFGSQQRSLTLLAIIAIAATVVTHHVTSYALVGFLVLWVLVGFVRRRSAPDEARPFLAAVFGLAAIAAWITLVAPSTIDYLRPHLEGGVQQVISLINGSSGGRTLFQDATGVQASLLERGTAYASVLLTLAALALGFWAMWRARQGRPLMVALAIVALAYPASLGLRLTSEGAEAAARASAFVYLGIAFVVATWGATLGRPRLTAAWRRLAAVASIVMFSGGVIAGSAPWARLPYPYRPAADSRSFAQEDIAAAQWTIQHLGALERFVADRQDRQLFGSYALGDAQRTDADRILLGTDPASACRLIALHQVDYVVVDNRITSVLPLVGGYVFVNELAGYRFTSPLDPAALAKFGSIQGADLVYDSGDIQIYDVEGIR
jgi:hypothetical protein